MVFEICERTDRTQSHRHTNTLIAIVLTLLEGGRVKCQDRQVEWCSGVPGGLDAECATEHALDLDEPRDPQSSHPDVDRCSERLEARRCCSLS